MFHYRNPSASSKLHRIIPGSQTPVWEPLSWKLRFLRTPTKPSFVEVRAQTGVWARGNAQHVALSKPQRIIPFPNSTLAVTNCGRWRPRRPTGRDAERPRRHWKRDPLLNLHRSKAVRGISMSVVKKSGGSLAAPKVSGTKAGNAKAGGTKVGGTKGAWHERRVARRWVARKAGGTKGGWHEALCVIRYAEGVVWHSPGLPRSGYPGYTTARKNNIQTPKGFRTMPQSLSNILVHIVFSTKERRPFLQDRELRDQTHRYLAGISKSLKCPAIQIGGMADHVHILARQSRCAATLGYATQRLRRSES